MPSENNILSRIVNKLRTIKRRYRDKHQGINIKKQEILLSSAYFDTEDYLERYEEVREFPAGACAHFFLHGLEEGKNARFFDAGWYSANYPDVASSSYDAYGHFKESLDDEHRAARFITIGTDFKKSRSLRYPEWVLKYDSVDSDNHKNIRKYCLEKPQNGNAISNDISIICNLNNITDPNIVKEFFSAIALSYYKNFELIVALPENINPEFNSIIDSFREFINIKYEIIKDVINENDIYIYETLVKKCSNDLIVKADINAILSPAFTYYCNNMQFNKKDALFAYFDHDNLNYKGNRSNPQFKPDFNLDLFLTNNYIGNVWAMDKSSFLRILPLLKYSDGFDYGIILKFIEIFGCKNIIHICKIGYHNQHNNIIENSQKNVQEYLNATNKNAIVCENEEVKGTNRIKYLLGDNQPKVSIIIPTRDKLEILKNCIFSILNNTNYKNYEIIIVDNGSVYPETLQFFEEIKLNKKVKILPLDIEFNYSVLNNRAAEFATGEYICLMNNDIEIITNEWIEEMLSFAIQHDVGCVGARLWYPNNTIQHAGVFIGYCGVAGHWHRHLKHGDNGYMHRAALQQTVSAVTAAVLMVKKSIYFEVGGLEEKLKVAFNDVDFCLKVRDHGYRNIYTPFAQMYHYESASRGKDITLEQKTREQYEIDFMKKKYGDALTQCPQYNPNLALESEDFELAFPPRGNDLH